jgi:predicted AAA+ superfamily ATPase
VRTLKDLEVHFSKGQLFENFILIEKMKNTWNNNTHEKYYFWRDSSGNEVDLLIEDALNLNAVEVKSSKTIHPDFFKNLKQFAKIKPDVTSYLVYGGTEFQKRTDGMVIGFNNLHVI